VLLDTLYVPSTAGVGEVYGWLKSILVTAVVQQDESTLLHWVEASILTPVCPRDGGQDATQGAPEVGMASSPARISAYDRLSGPGTGSDPQSHQRQCPGGNNSQSQ
jgi:hypothetical protein